MAFIDLSNIPPAPDGTGLAAGFRSSSNEQRRRLQQRYAERDFQIGQLGPGAQLVIGIVGAVAQAGGTIGAAMISADAAKYAVRKQVQGELTIALAQQAAELKAFEAQAALIKAQEEQQTLREEQQAVKATQVAAQVAVRATQSAAETQSLIVTLAPYIGLAIAATGVAAVIAVSMNKKQRYPQYQYQQYPQGQQGQQYPSQGR